MSQMEMIMFVALAVAVVALVALLAGRIVWASARNVRKWRLRRSRPDAVAALKAERDRLKAEHAMLAQRLEMRLAELKERFVHQEAEVSRARNRTGMLAEKLEAAARVISERDAQIKGLKELTASLEADLEKRAEALHEAREEARARAKRIAELEKEHEALKRELADRERQLAILREEITSPVEEGATLASSNNLNAEERLAAKIAELNRMAQQLENQRKEMLAANKAASKEHDGQKADKEIAHIESAGGPGLSGKLEEAEKEARKIDKEIREIDDIWKNRLASLKTIDEAVARRGGGKARSASPRKVEKTSAANTPKADKKKLKTGKKSGNAKKPRTSSKPGKGTSKAGAPRPVKSSGSEPSRNVVSLAARIRALKKQSR